MATHSRSGKRRLAVAVTAAAAVVGTTLMALPAGAAPAGGKIYGADAKNAVSGSYVVLLKDGAAAKTLKTAGKKDLAATYGGKLARNYSALEGFSATGLSESEAKRLAADPAVDKVVRDQKFTITGTQNNPPSWGLDRIDQTATAGDGAYTYPDSAGQGVTAYVIDTGVRVTHQDFEGRASLGYDAIDGDNSADDGHGHGTHVAGTIAGASHGVAKKAKIVAVRVLDDNGSGTTAGVVAGIDWVAENASGPSVANMSLGGGADAALDAAVRTAISSGVTFAVAAGNESRNASTGSPARVTEAITVASSTSGDQQSSFSNFGSVVDLYAPGSSITSTWNSGDSSTNTISGTSMATPHVAGAAAVYLSGHTTAGPAQVASALTGGATSGAIKNATGGTPNKLLKIVE
ncbi:S8 family peptidase [Streptomyces xinghaiensis]|uniref:S8 family peptidase n=1 Tax=Streptomyces xinghaiensis TaxID=1038928 RepID=UPI0002F49263|nr:S8 family peptidase [Streptomyces xinghaiensis]MZE79021.1 S8 family serine peptidase [Streptomyces sp. SID5475]